MLLLGAMLGAAAAAATFPAAFLIPRAGLDWAPVGDAAQHAIAQRYFLAAPWAWPPLEIFALDLPRGTNLAFADGIPLLAFALRPFAPLLPTGFHGIGLFYAIAHVLQPVAAIWALRGTGERRLLPALGVALAALAMPAWLARYGHAALTGHFLLLLGLGSYLRLVEEQTVARWLGAAAIALASLLIHPYLAAMVLALLGAVPASLLARAEPGWRAALAGVAGIGLLVGAVMAAFGYLGATGDGGYGDFALNLASPVWPHRSLLLPGLAGAEIDATGKGGWEGYNWLGAGLVLGLAALVLLLPRTLPPLLARHAGLLLVLLGLTALAVSFRVGLGARIVLDLGPAPAMLEQFRASGRFFWPVAYALLIGAAAMLARAAPGGATLVLAMGVLQAVDSLPIRADLSAWADRRAPWRLEAEALRPLLRDASRLTLLPSWPCIARDDLAAYEAVQQALLLASETATPVTTMQLARWRSPPRCDDTALAASPFAPGELRLVLAPALPALLPLIPEAEARCRMLGSALACTDPAPPSPPAPAAPAAEPVELPPEPLPLAPRWADDAPPDTGDAASSR